jgi:fructose-specific phosphotransferase system IIC component
MAETVAASDMGIGLAMFFGVLALVGAAGMYVMAAQQVLAAWSFAGAIIAGTLAVAAVHLYGGHRE